jgi:hypothetical protein
MRKMRHAPPRLGRYPRALCRGAGALFVRRLTVRPAMKAPAGFLSACLLYVPVRLVRSRRLTLHAGAKRIRELFVGIRLMARFVKIPDRDSFQVDRVALQLFSSSDGARGSVNSPSNLNEGIPTVFEPDLAAPEAAHRATDYADQLSTDVEVFDPDNLWQSEWGKLE